jgi:hypothetical protein
MKKALLLLRAPNKPSLRAAASPPRTAANAVLLAGIILFALLAACEAVPKPSETPVPSAAAVMTSLTPTSSPTIVPTETQAPPASSTADTRLPPERWQEWPVIPERVSARTSAIYQRGQELGNNPAAFSKIGDCESTPTWFLGAFDGKPSDYSLGKYADLQAVIEAFHGSYGRTSLAAGRGFSSANALASLWADRTACEANETPLACELRVNRPAFALIMLGTNDVYHQDTFESNMRILLDSLIQKGVVPILATKADNLEGDQAINATIARLAYEYDLPLWNFWLAVQPLPAHGLQPDGSHLTWAGPYFDDPVRMKAAWPWRNLTGLQVLDEVWRNVTGQH